MHVSFLSLVILAPTAPIPPHIVITYHDITSKRPVKLQFPTYIPDLATSSTMSSFASFRRAFKRDDINYSVVETSTRQDQPHAQSIQGWPSVPQRLRMNALGIATDALLCLFPIAFIGRSLRKSVVSIDTNLGTHSLSNSCLHA
jgi:hypothetical protein